MRKSWVCCIFCLIVSVLCAVLSAFCFTYAHSFLNSMTFVTQDTRFDSETLTQIVQPEADDTQAYTAAAWRQSTNQTITAEENQRSCQTDVIALYGVSRCILPYGKNLQTDQQDGCIISETLAEELFASHQVEGQKIQYAGYTWRICDVIKQPERLFVFEAAALLEDMQFDHISVILSDGASRQLTAERFVSRYGLSAQLLRLDFYSSVQWLAEMIPAKWSDFDGWKQNWDEKKQEMQLTATAEKSAVDLLYLQSVKRGYLFAGAAVLTLLLFLRKGKSLIPMEEGQNTCTIDEQKA